MNFLRNFLASILGTLVAFGVLFFMFILLASLLNTEDAVVVAKNSVLELKIKYPIRDFVGKDDADPFSLFFERSQSLDDILDAIKVAKEDDKIKGISISNNFLSAGYSTAQAIRKALENFKESGKFVFAYGDFYSQKDYYLASVADSVFINPVGSMDFKGLSAEVLYFKSLQEKSGVKMEVIRHGKYKSAVEPFLADEMSEENRNQISELLGSFWNEIITEISVSRNLSVDQLNTIADTLGGRNPRYAKRTGLIDGLLHYDEYENKLKALLGLEKTNELNTINLRKYTKISNVKRLKTGKDKLAVIFAQGQIFYGEGGPDNIGQGIIVKAIRKARDDKSVKAIVLRVNSPGGSAVVADIIWRELELAKKEKPLVVSMGDMAASGGYYIAAGANKIYAEPTTITGSIGVFGTIPNISELAKNVGINAEQVGTNKNSVDYSLFEPMGNEFRKVVTESVEDVYDIFLERVASGRGLTIAEVDSLAQGRVWSGADAKENGLIDELGGLEDAIVEAAKLAELKEYSLKKYPRYKSSFERFMEDMEGASLQVKQNWVREELGPELLSLYNEVKGLMNQKGVQARLPHSLTIK
ncbi:MAG: signal peptide peptidase SppA [Eudoraea sp.]